MDEEMTSTLWQHSPLYDELSVLVAGVTVLQPSTNELLSGSSLVAPAAPHWSTDWPCGLGAFATICVALFLVGLFGGALCDSGSTILAIL